MSTIAVSSNDLLLAIERVKHAVAKEPSRPVLTTICLERHGEGLRLVAADNYRIAWMDIDTDAEGFEGQALIRCESLPMLVLFLKQAGTFVSLDFDSKANSLTFGGNYKQTLTLRLMDGTYPAYMQVIPVDAPFVAAFNPSYLADCGKAMRKTAGLVVKLHQAAPLSPMLVEDSYGGEVLMPVKTTDFAELSRPAAAEPPAAETLVAESEAAS